MLCEPLLSFECNNQHKKTFELILMLFFSERFSIVITSSGEETAGLYDSHAFVCLSYMHCT